MGKSRGAFLYCHRHKLEIPAAVLVYDIAFDVYGSGRYAFNVYTSGSATNLGNQAIGETASWSTPNCTPPGSPAPDLCASDPAGTSGSGTFSDQWILATDNVSPVGCGFTVNYDHWQMCFNGNPITFGTLNGYVHSNSINIEGSIMPPQSNQMQTGMRINP
jgi:hypothetical protein